MANLIIICNHVKSGVFCLKSNYLDVSMHRFIILTFIFRVPQKIKNVNNCI